jgi:purine-cytosine permease-like protein
MKYFKYIIAIIIYAALMLCTIFVPQTTSPALGSEIVYDIAMIGVAIAIAVTMSKFEQAPTTTSSGETSLWP